jgi:hypothetical protein
MEATSALCKRSSSLLKSKKSFDDATVVHLLGVIASPEATIIDPVLISILVSKRGSLSQDDGNVEGTRRRFAEAVSCDRLVLLPLHHNNHWSLLAYRPAWTQWYHCDSVRGYHKARVVEVLACLDHFAIGQSQDARIFFYDDMEEQPRAYECGRYVPFYAFVLLGNHLAHSQDQAECERRLERELPLVCEEFRPGFQEQLCAIIATRHWAACEVAREGNAAARDTRT